MTSALGNWSATVAVSGQSDPCLPGGRPTVDGPDARAGSQIDDLLRVLPDRREEELAVGELEVQGVLHVLAGLLVVVVRDGIPPVFVLVVLQRT